ncbi:MAG: sugar phosphate nucleotidyltransferase [archaeon]
MVKKVVIPVAGFGTRMHPVTKTIPKEILPIINVPIMHYVITEAMAAGMTEFIFVVSEKKFPLIQDYVQTHYPNLITKYVIQKEMLGLADAILITEEVVGNEPFALMYPDNIIKSNIPCLRQLVDVHEKYNKSVMAVAQVSNAELSKRGIIRPKEVEDKVFRVIDFLEKPSEERAPSNLASVGRLIFDPVIFEYLKKSGKGDGENEQMAVAMRMLIQDKGLHALEFEGTRYDTGNPYNYVQAFMACIDDFQDCDKMKQYIKMKVEEW